MFTLAHIADLHATPRGGIRLRDLLNKRLSGWVSWKIRRSRMFRPEILDALLEDLNEQRPDHVAVTGDLVNLALEQEFVAAARWLERLGGPQRVSVVPGNHDAYVRVAMARSWNHWAHYMSSDGAASADAIHLHDFPTLRVRDDVALVGVCSALPTGLFRATGRVGGEQLERLERLLSELAERSLCRVVQIHHPPIDEGLPRRKRLTDSAELRALLARAGAELVIHAHHHLCSIRSTQGPQGAVPVVGVRSASNIGENPDMRAQYHLYRIDRRSGARYRIRMAIREWHEGTGRFLSLSDAELATGLAPSLGARNAGQAAA